MEDNKTSKISEIHIFSLKEGEFAIDVKLDGIKQAYKKITKEDVHKYLDRQPGISETKQRKELAQKYFANTENKIDIAITEGALSYKPNEWSEYPHRDGYNPKWIGKKLPKFNIGDVVKNVEDPYRKTDTTNEYRIINVDQLSGSNRFIYKTNEPLTDYQSEKSLKLIRPYSDNMEIQSLTKKTMTKKEKKQPVMQEEAAQQKSQTTAVKKTAKEKEVSSKETKKVKNDKAEKTKSANDGKTKPAVEQTTQTDGRPKEWADIQVGDKVLYNGKVSTVHSFVNIGEEQRVRLDTGLAPVMYQSVEWKDIKRVESSMETKKTEKAPQLITVNGNKISHAHAFKSENSDNWFWTAKIDDKPLRPVKISKEEADAYMKKETSVETLMNKYYPTKMEKQLSPEDFKKANVLEDGRKIDNFFLFKEKNENKEGFGRWKAYASIDGEKISPKEVSYRNLNAYFDRTTTPAKIVEQTFGAELHLASYYKQYELKNDKVQDIMIAKEKDGKWKISANLGEFGNTDKKPLSYHDGYSFFTAKTATKEQLAAKYLTNDIAQLINNKQETKIGKKL